MKGRAGQITLSVLGSVAGLVIALGGLVYGFATKIANVDASSAQALEMAKYASEKVEKALSITANLESKVGILQTDISWIKLALESNNIKPNLRK